LRARTAVLTSYGLPLGYMGDILGGGFLLSLAGWLGDPVPGQQAAALGADRLSGLFLALSFGAAVAVLARGATPRSPPLMGSCPAPPYPPAPQTPLGARAGRGRGDHDRAGRVHRPVRLGGADARLLPAV